MSNGCKDAAFLEEAIAILELLRDPDWIDQDNEETLNQSLSHSGTNGADTDRSADERYAAQSHDRRSRIKVLNGGPNLVSG